MRKTPYSALKVMRSRCCNLKFLSQACGSQTSALSSSDSTNSIFTALSIMWGQEDGSVVKGLLCKRGCMEIVGGHGEDQESPEQAS